MARRPRPQVVQEEVTVEKVNKPNNHLKLRIDDLNTFEPLTDNQKKFFDAYKQQDYFIALLGSPGVGKTFLALLKGIEEVLDKSNSFQKIVVIRSAVQVRDQGFVPGTLEEKMATKHHILISVQHYLIEKMLGKD